MCFSFIFSVSVIEKEKLKCGTSKELVVKERIEVILRDFRRGGERAAKRLDDGR
jgi:hypothetical protein